MSRPKDQGPTWGLSELVWMQGTGLLTGAVVSLASSAAGIPALYRIAIAAPVAIAVSLAVCLRLWDRYEARLKAYFHDGHLEGPIPESEIGEPDAHEHQGVCPHCAHGMPPPRLTDTPEEYFAREAEAIREVVGEKRAKELFTQYKLNEMALKAQARRKRNSQN